MGMLLLLFGAMMVYAVAHNAIRDSWRATKRATKRNPRKWF